ncbi:hypothetical protein [Halocola ammonii]
MIFIKRLFITVFSVWLIVVPIVSLIEFIGSQGDVYWFAPMIGPLGILTYFAFVKWRKPFDSKTASLVITVMLGVCLLITVGQRFFDSEEIVTPIYLALGSLLGWLLYDRWFTSLPLINIVEEHFDPSGLKSASDENGSSEQAKFHVYIFHMGQSDPYSEAQARYYKKFEEDFKKTNAQIAFVSEEKSLTKITKDSEVFTTLVDSDLKLAEKLKIVQDPVTPRGFLKWAKKVAIPTLLIEQNGKVIFSRADKDYRNRPDAEFILRILEAN